MFRLYHGTTEKAYLNISKNGFHPKPSKAWTCSDSNNIYFYNPLYMFENNERDSIEECQELAMQYANENAQIQNALEETPDKFTVVIELIIEEEFKEEFKEDYSCAGTNFAMQIKAERLNELIKENKISFIPHFFPFCVKLSLAYIAGLVDNPLFEKALNSLTYIEREMLKVLSKVDFFLDDLFFAEELKPCNFEDLLSIE